MNTFTHNPTAALGAGFAASALIALVMFALGPTLGFLFTPTGAQALIFAAILVAIFSGTGCSISALQDYLVE